MPEPTPHTDFLKHHSLPLANDRDLDALIERIGNKHCVLLGEASHGTHEYYTWRAKITKRLVAEKGFRFIAVEGDWPDCYKINKWVKGYYDDGESIQSILRTFKRWPKWMWANWEVAAFASWLKKYNTRTQRNVGFYGMDVYSLWDSMEVILDYLQKEDPQAAELAKEAVRCFEPFRQQDNYASVFSSANKDCEDEVRRLLTEVRRKAFSYDTKMEAGLNAEINALVMANAEKYYKAMSVFGANSWNVRDRHMMETLYTIEKHHSGDAKTILWAHNTHVGDARATDMLRQGLVNIGQLARQHYGEDQVALIGMGSYQGTVLAAKNWGDPVQHMEMPPAQPTSFESAWHEAVGHDAYVFYNGKTPGLPDIGHRAIGVVYHPTQERGNYVPSEIASRYDAFVHLEKTTALHPIHKDEEQTLESMPETYPFGL